MFTKEAEWGGRLEFLMACIATSVGLGNVWRFPFTAYENGGGAFLIPYIIVLILVGKPFYLLEGLLGQFTSRSCAKTWYMTPAMKGKENKPIYFLYKINLILECA
ncbi:NAAT1 protein, partial [Acromyrmex insinuator]